MRFTFSFPCELNSINSATLLKWTKGFSASDVEGKGMGFEKFKLEPKSQNKYHSYLTYEQNSNVGFKRRTVT